MLLLLGQDTGEPPWTPRACVTVQNGINIYNCPSRVWTRVIARGG